MERVCSSHGIYMRESIEETSANSAKSVLSEPRARLI